MLHLCDKENYASFMVLEEISLGLGIGLQTLFGLAQSYIQYVHFRAYNYVCKDFLNLRFSMNNVLFYSDACVEIRHIQYVNCI